MSLDAMRWALKQNIRPSSCKFVLVSLADRADERHNCFPSVGRLCADTSLDRKTVMKMLDILEKAGVIGDTGNRRGKTKSVKVWKLLGVSSRDGDEPEIIHALDVKQFLSSTNNGTAKLSQNSLLSSTNNGTAKLSQKRYTEPISNNQSIEPTTGNSDEGLIMPENLSEHAVVVSSLVGCFEKIKAQAMVDELSTKVANGLVNNVPGYLRGMVNNAGQGVFVPSSSSDSGRRKVGELAQRTIPPRYVMPDVDMLDAWADAHGYPARNDGDSDARYQNRLHGLMQGNTAPASRANG